MVNWSSHQTKEVSIEPNQIEKPTYRLVFDFSCLKRSIYDGPPPFTTFITAHLPLFAFNTMRYEPSLVAVGKVLSGRILSTVIEDGVLPGSLLDCIGKLPPTTIKGTL